VTAGFEIASILVECHAQTSMEQYAGDRAQTKIAFLIAEPQRKRLFCPRVTITQLKSPTASFVRNRFKRKISFIFGEMRQCELVTPIRHRRGAQFRADQIPNGIF
jgi:hypothetical protein